MTYDHAVKVNGKWFKAGDEVVFPLPVLGADQKDSAVDDTKTKQVEKETKTTTKRSYKKKENK